MTDIEPRLDNFFADRKILITGAAGTVGRELVRQLAEMQPAELRLMDNNESEMFFLMDRYKSGNIFCFLGDVRDGDRLRKLATGMDIIIHTAAFKHVILSEYNPFDVVQTNIIGVENVIRAANAANVKYVLFTSSDKAVNPTNVMGTTKLMGERLITAANATKNISRTIFSSTRFGNVIGSRGSVVPLFKRQIQEGDHVTLTDPGMTRFIMTIAESARLVLRSITLARGGEVFVTKMPVARIVDLAQAMIEILAPRHGKAPKDIEIRRVGSKPGEKLYEELLSGEETHRAIELENMFVVTPAFKAIYHDIVYDYPGVVAHSIANPYVSSLEAPMGKDELIAYLLEHKVLDNLEGV